MRLIVCCSQSWFKLSDTIYEHNTVKFLTKNSELNPEFVNYFNPDYIFYPHWNWAVKKEIHERYDCIVFHTAPLPYGRGGSPIQNLILDGFKHSPVCALKMTSRLDAGPVYASINISLAGNLECIFRRISRAINHLIVKIITETLEPSEQVGEPHQFKRLSEKDNEIPAELKLEEIYDRIRMVDHPDYPNAFIIYGDKKIEFSDASLKGELMEATCLITKLK